MGMTIEEQIKALEYLKKCGIFPFSDIRTGIVITDEYVDGAIDTMRKYQKIATIIEMWNEVNDFSYNQAMRKIGEVIKDGNVD